LEPLPETVLGPDDVIVLGGGPKAQTNARPQCSNPTRSLRAFETIHRIQEISTSDKYTQYTWLCEQIHFWTYRLSYRALVHLATTGKNSCRQPARIVDADHLRLRLRVREEPHDLRFYMRDRSRT